MPEESRHGSEHVVLVAPAGRLAERQGLAPQSFKAHQPELPVERVAHYLAAGAAGFGADSLQLQQWIRSCVLVPHSFQAPPRPTAPTPLITCTPGVRSGKACVAGTRSTVSDVLEHMASGMSQEKILGDFPDLRPEHIQAVLRYAAEREKRLSELTVT